MSAYDTAAVQHALAAVNTNMAAMNAYCQATTSIVLGSRPIVVDGQTCANIDPLSPFPGVEPAIQAAQQHCQAFQNSQTDIGGMLQMLVPAMQPEFASISQTLAAIPSGGAPTATQEQAITSALTIIGDGMTAVLQAIAANAQGVTTFAQQLVADNAALVTGSNDLNGLIPQVQQSFVQSEEQWVGQIMGSAIIGLLQQLAQQIVSNLQSIANSIGGAVNAEQPLSATIANLNSIFQAISQQLQDVQTALPNATPSQFVPIVEKCDVDNALRFWKTFSGTATG